MAVNAYHLLNRLSDVYNISVINMKILNKSIPVLTFKKIDLRWMTDMFSIVICYSSRFVKIKLSCVLNFLRRKNYSIKLSNYLVFNFTTLVVSNCSNSLLLLTNSGTSCFMSPTNCIELLGEAILFSNSLNWSMIAF